MKKQFQTNWTDSNVESSIPGKARLLLWHEEVQALCHDIICDTGQTKVNMW